MRIGLNAAFLGKAHNGVSTYTRGLIKAFGDYRSAESEEYLIYTSSEEDVPAARNFVWRRTPRRLCTEYGTSGNSLRLFWTQCILPRLLLNDRIEVLLSPLPESPVFSRTPRVVVVHDLIPLFYPKEAPRLAPYYRYIVPSSLRRACKIVADSEHTRQDLISAFGIDGRDIAVAYLGVDDCYFSPNGLASAPSDCPKEYFLFVGACLPRKNPLAAIHAYAKIHKRLNHKLVLVTSRGTYLNEIERNVRELGLGDRVVFYSTLPQHQMQFLYKHATALVFLSEYEGFGYPAAEAMAAGTPSIVSAGTSLPEVVGDAGVVVPAGDLDAAAAAMLNLALDEVSRNNLQELTRHRAKSFRWKVITDELATILSRALGAGSEQKNAGTL
jgi:glycosyltransferase involved in cell wall biosynthesis